MIRTFLKALILVPIAVLLVLFAVANRQWTSISLDPFASDPPVLAIALPLFLAILGAVIVGVVIGGIAAWIGQRKWRRAARRLEAELASARRDAADWKHRAEAAHAQATTLTPLTYRHPTAA